MNDRLIGTIIVGIFAVIAIFGIYAVTPDGCSNGSCRGGEPRTEIGKKLKEMRNKPCYEHPGTEDHYRNCIQWW